MRFGILGSLEIDGPDGALYLSGRRRRAVAAYLLFHHGRPVPLDRIIDDIWEGEPADGAAGTVQTYISQFRRLFTTATITKRPAGYVLELSEPDELDAARFDRSAGELAAAPDATRASHSAQRRCRCFAARHYLSSPDRSGPTSGRQPCEQCGRACWSGTSPRCSSLAIISRRLRCWKRRSPRSRSTSVSGRNSWWRTTVRDGRPTHCGAVQRLRRHLAEELGIQPGPELRALEQRILEQDPALHPGRAPERMKPGVVTFMLTDVVDSVHLWDTQPAQMSMVLADKKS